MAIAELLGETSLTTFMEGYYLRLPYAQPGGCRHLAPLGDWETIGRIVAAPGADVVAGREGTPWSGPLPHTTEEARAVLAAGFTLGLRHAEQHDPALAELAAGFCRDFAAPIDIHLYVTPAGQPGFGWHYDAEDVFVLQLRGAKEWLLRKNTVNPWPLVEALPEDMAYAREIMPLLRCPLAAGDWLYIPAGYWHATRAGQDESVSLSVGVKSLTALDALDALRRRLVHSLLWRQRLPPLGTASTLTPEALLAHYREVFADLGKDLAEAFRSEEFVRGFVDVTGRNCDAPRETTPASSPR